MIYTGSAAEAKVTTTTGTAAAADLVSVFKGTPMVMSKAARTAADALTAVFIVVDDIMPVMPHVVPICKETGTTPTVAAKVARSRVVFNIIYIRLPRLFQTP
jgi:hypothetical protein